MAEKIHYDEDPKLDELVALNFKLTERERRAFKMWCAVSVRGAGVISSPSAV